MNNRRTGFQFFAGTDNFLFSTASELALETTQTLAWLTWGGGFLPQSKANNETDHSTVSSVWFESAHNYGIMGSITYSGNFTLTKDHFFG
jgi:hypothetical protein